MNGQHLGLGDQRARERRAQGEGTVWRPLLITTLIMVMATSARTHFPWLRYHEHRRSGLRQHTSPHSKESEAEMGGPGLRAVLAELAAPGNARGGGSCTFFSPNRHRIPWLTVPHHSGLHFPSHTPSVSDSCPVLTRTLQLPWTPLGNPDNLPSQEARCARLCKPLRSPL